MALDFENPLEAACFYVEEGYAITLLGDGGTDNGKKPRRRGWTKSLIKSIADCRDCWGKYPNANIGLLTGSVNSLIVLDVDFDHGGKKSLERLVRFHSPIPPTVRQCTGRGEHYFFACDAVVRNSVGLLGEGLDVRGDGGMVVVPPSIHPSGAVYQWQTPLARQSLAQAPEWLLECLSGGSRPTSRSTCDSLVRQGERNTFLFKTAGKLRREGNTGINLLALVMKCNQVNCEPPLESEEVEKIVHSVQSSFRSHEHVLFRYRDAICCELSGDPTMRHILHVISFHMDVDGKPAFPTREQIASKTGYSCRTVSTKIKKAVKLGLIKVTKHLSPGQQYSNNVYSIPQTFFRE